MKISLAIFSILFAGNSANRFAHKNRNQKKTYTQKNVLEQIATALTAGDAIEEKTLDEYKEKPELDPKDCISEPLEPLPPPKKNPNVMVTRFNQGSAKWMFDVLDTMFQVEWEKEAQAMFDFYKTAKPKAGAEKSRRLRASKSKKPKFDDEIPEDGVAAALQDFIEPKALMDAKRALKIFVGDKESMNMREFLFFMITYLGKRASGKVEFENSFKQTRKGIKELFEYLDCTKGGVIDSSMVFDGFQNLDTELTAGGKTEKFRPTSGQCNTFVYKGNLSGQEKQLDFEEFQSEILFGMMERHVPKDKIDNSALDVEKLGHVEQLVLDGQDK